MPRLPERIGRFRVTGELGRGAMGTVYRGRDDSLDREVALKVMSEGIADPDARARFQREGRAAARLQHPNIVVIYELGEHEGSPYMALELLEGVDLQRAIGGGIRPDPRATLPLVLQLLSGLAHAHEHGIVHRDVKPSNLFLPFGKPAKIMDFGVARLAGAGTTTSGAIVGTPNYMSPEQVSGGDLDGRSDLFSAGLILYELVTGEKAIRADTVVSAMYKILHERPDLSLIPDQPSWRRLRSVIERALERRPEDRFPDARTMATELAAALVELGGTVDWTVPSDHALLVRPKPASVSTEATVSARATSAATPSTPARPRPAPAAGRRPDVAPSRVPVSATAASPPPRYGSLVLGGVGVVAVLAIGSAAVLLSRTAPSSPNGLTATAAPGATATPTSPTLAPASPAAVRSPSPHPASTPAVAATTTPGSAAAEPTPSPRPKLEPGLTPEARLARARELVSRQRWADALAEARAVLEAQPTSREASTLAQQAEEEIVVDECLRSAQKALREGDRDRAIEELRRGFMVRKDDPRLLALHREAVQ